MKKTKVLNLPKKDKETGEPFLSYSQWSTFNKNKRDYFRQYFFNEKFTGNSYTEFGSKLGEALEKNDFSEFDKKHHKYLKTIPRFDQFERKIKWELNGFYVVGYIDTNKEDYSELLDYKTGDIKTKVAEYEDEKYVQLNIYAAAIEQETGVLPDKASVVLIDRAGNAFQGEELTLVGEHVIIEKDVSKEKNEEVKQRIQEDAELIAEYYSVFEKLLKVK